MIRVLIIADTSDRAEAFASQLEEDDRFESSEAERADVILCLGIPRRRLPLRGKPVVAVSNDTADQPAFDDYLKAWLPASAQLNEIAAALIAACSGFTVLTGSQTRRTFQSIPTSDELVPEVGQLTTREQEVLVMMASGFSNKQIAARLNISANTAKFHVRQIMGKLDADSRTQAVSIAIRRGLVPI